MSNQTQFSDFARVIHTQFQAMQSSTLYELDITGDELWEHYLASFPKGTNPIYRERTEHDCSCCRQFIKTVGRLVNIVEVEGELELLNVWELDHDAVGYPYDVVAAKVSVFLDTLPIQSIYKADHKLTQFGNEKTLEPTDTGVHTWHHFHAKIDAKHVLGARNTREASVAEFQGNARTTRDVMVRGCIELSKEALNTVMDLIKAGSLYRGEEHFAAVEKFANLWAAYHNTDSRDLFIWKNIDSPVARFRNTAIGTLVTDLSEGVDLEDAVKQFESKVAPENYKRSSALITPAMVEKAMDTLETLDLRDSVERRHAAPADVSVNDVLFADGSVKAVMRDALTSSLLDAAVTPDISLDGAKKIDIEEFLERIVPQSKSISVLLEGTHLSNFMSVTAPVHERIEPLFKWRNNFAWSYDGDAADSIIKRNVKKQGGNVDNALMRVSLAWDYACDLDIHIHEPDGNHIYYYNKSGKLDVDANAGGGFSMKDPVENVSWSRPPQDGLYRVRLHNFAKVSSGKGFSLEVESNGNVTEFTYDKAVTRTHVECFTLQVKAGQVVDIVNVHKDLRMSSRQQDKWGVKTGSLVPLDMLLLSPNHWGDQGTGNKHYFFILRDCLNPDRVRGIYNEFLREDLNEHRKVFEVLGDKTKAEFSPIQLSGIGFSSTVRSSVKVIAVSHKGRSIALDVQF